MGGALTFGLTIGLGNSSLETVFTGCLFSNRRKMLLWLKWGSGIMDHGAGLSPGTGLCNTVRKRG